MRNLISFSLTVIIVSLSVCLAQNTQQDVKPTQQQPVTPVLDAKQADVKAMEQDKKNDTQAIAQTGSAQPATVPTQVTPAQDQKAAQSGPAQTAQSNTSTPAAETQKNETAKPVDNTTDNKGSQEKTQAVTQKSEEQVGPTKETLTNGTKPEEKANTTQSTTKPEEKEKADAVTPKNETAKSTVAPEATPVLQTRAFDGPSFVGGIVLTLGLLAISFVGFKYYKNLTKENYHIL